MTNIHNSAYTAKQLADYLKAEGFGEDEQLLLDTIEGQTDLIECIDKVMVSALEDKALAEGISLVEEDMATRRARFSKRADAKKAAIFRAMQEAGLSKLERPAFTLSIRAGTPKVVITDEEQVPDVLMRHKKEPDKAAIGDLLKAGQQLPYATLSNGEPSLQVRTK